MLIEKCQLILDTFQTYKNSKNYKILNLQQNEKGMARKYCLFATMPSRGCFLLNKDCKGLLLVSTWWENNIQGILNAARY